MFSVSSGLGTASGMDERCEAADPPVRRAVSAAGREFLDKLADLHAWPRRAHWPVFVATLGDLLPVWDPWPKGVGLQFSVESGDGEAPFLHRYGSPHSPHLALSLVVDDLDGERSTSVALVRGREHLDSARFSGLPQGFFEALAAGMAMAKRHLPERASLPDLPNGEHLRRALAGWLEHHHECLPPTLRPLAWASERRSVTSPPGVQECAAAVEGCFAFEPALGPQMPPSLLASLQARAKALADTLRAGLLPHGFLQWLPHLLIRQPVEGVVHWSAMYVEQEGVAHYYGRDLRGRNRVRWLRALPDGTFEAGGAGASLGVRYGNVQDALFQALRWLGRVPDVLTATALRLSLADRIEANPILVSLCQAVAVHFPQAANKECLLRQCIRNGQATWAGYQLLCPESVTQSSIDSDVLWRWRCQLDFRAGGWRQEIFNEGFSVLQAQALVTPCGLTKAGRSMWRNPFRVFFTGPDHLSAEERLRVQSELLHFHGSASEVAAALGISVSTWSRWWTGDERLEAQRRALTMFAESAMRGSAGASAGP